MKKLTVTAILITTILILSACGETSSFRQATDGIMSNNLEKTVSNYILMEEDTFSLSIYGFTEYISPIATIALQLLFNTNDFDAEFYEARHNHFFHSIIYSRYMGENHVMYHLIDENSSSYEFYLAFEIAFLLNDIELIEILKQKYNLNPAYIRDLDDQIFHLMIQDKLDHEIFRIDAKVLENLEILVYHRNFDPEWLVSIYSKIAYIQHFNVEVNEELLQNLYYFFMDSENQRFVLSIHEVIAANYMMSLSRLMELLSIDELEQTFFYEHLRYTYRIYYPVQYEIFSPRNLAFYLTLLYFSNIDVNSEMHDQHIRIFNRIVNEITVVDQETLFYLNYIAEKLGLSLDLEQETFDFLDENIFLNYFVLKNQNQTLPYIPRMPTSTWERLLYFDSVYSIEKYVSYFNEIDIFDYIDDVQFPMKLNLYTAIAIDNNLMTYTMEQEIENFILSRQNIFGFSGKYSNFDFTTSVYYTNILNMLHRGESYGLR